MRYFIGSEIYTAGDIRRSQLCLAERSLRAEVSNFSST
jgi:hypothetical protein